MNIFTKEEKGSAANYEIQKYLLVHLAHP